ncbi:family 3 adenylate cyclase [Nannocystis sp. SCPEA4]|uniref:family 3 adenylate cyclase n=1 Tax=Nannocystis sp. SCPEA4 TaxID=2996787 RepID=UPI00227134BF|nr:family 3 adenylate cyclase [Nannocystis sp. SCPEA4]MCY1057392.1 family 3 adenylate cyclase [Nannocystis sp. SCPEA4]
MVTKLARTQYSPALFDLAQDIVGGLPLRLLERWLESDQTEADAMRLLEACRVTGYNVVSDSTGLTRLTAERGLMEILAIIDQPKAIVHALGTAIGGESVGIWAADNTQMFYPAAVAAERLLAALLTVQDEVARRCEVKIGLAAHFGDFYSASGGLYGDESDAIEELAENHIGGDEVVVSEAVVRRLPPAHGFTLVARGNAAGLGALWRVTDGPRLSLGTSTSRRYPIPYSDAFYADLVRFEGRLGDRELAREMTAKYTQHKVVVLVERQAQDADSRAVALFNNLSLSATMKDAGLRHLDEAHGVEVKVSGPLGIYTFDDPARALAFARTFRRELAAGGIDCRIGVDLGPVLVFDLAGGGKDIAGMPVNIASKMAQDRGEWGKLYLSDRVHARVDAPEFRERRFHVSGVELRAFEG